VGRRQVLCGIAGLGLAAAWPLAAGCDRPTRQAQDTAVHRVGLLIGGFRSEVAPDIAAAYRQGLREYGWVEGRNLVVEVRADDGDPQRDDALAAELVSAGVEVIVALNLYMLQAARRATSTIPIVMAGTHADPVGEGLARSLDRPGGNVTGITYPPYEVQTGKLLEVFTDALPALRRVGILWNTGYLGDFRPAGVGAPTAYDARGAEQLAHGYEEGARSLGITVEPMAVRDIADLEDAFAAAREAGAGGVVMTNVGPPSFGPPVFDLAARHRLPLASLYDFWTPGTLVTYAADSVERFRAAVRYVDRILRGARPAGLPIERPSAYRLLINLKIAAALGLNIPPAFLARATEVIQ
jgi:putative ABC transport system substrate-binding protein